MNDDDSVGMDPELTRTRISTPLSVKPHNRTISLGVALVVFGVLACFVDLELILRGHGRPLRGHG